MAVRLVLFGAPGAGKGTQASFLKEHFDAMHIGTGELFRKAMQDKTALGEQVRGYIDLGLLVPDDIVTSLVRRELVEVIGENSFIFDGFPRTLPQAQNLDRALAEVHCHLTAVVSLEVTQDLLVHRISGRRLCPKCGAFYHEDSLRGSGNKCPVDQVSLERRKDDEEAAVKTRLETFMRQTLPLKEYYRKQNLLLEIDGAGSPQIVFERILDALQSVFN